MTAKRMFEALRAYNRRLQATIGDEFHLRAPFWWLHLPDSREVKIARLSYDGPLMVFTSFWSTSERRDDFLLLPEAVVLSVRTSTRVA